MSTFLLKHSHQIVKDYYAALTRFHEHGHTTEGNTIEKTAEPQESYTEKQHFLNAALIEF